MNLPNALTYEVDFTDGTATRLNVPALADCDEAATQQRGFAVVNRHFADRAIARVRLVSHEPAPVNYVCPACRTTYTQAPTHECPACGAWPETP